MSGTFSDKICKNCGHDEYHHRIVHTDELIPRPCTKEIFNNEHCKCLTFNPISDKSRKEIFELMIDYQCEFEKAFSKLLKINISQGIIPQSQPNNFHKLQNRCILLQEAMSQITWRLLFGEYSDFDDLK